MLRLLMYLYYIGICVRCGLLSLGCLLDEMDLYMLGQNVTCAPNPLVGVLPSFADRSSSSSCSSPDSEAHANVAANRFLYDVAPTLDQCPLPCKTITYFVRKMPIYAPRSEKHCCSCLDLVSC